MNDVTTETQTEKKFDPEAFAMNLAGDGEQRSGARGFMKRATTNQDKLPTELGEVVKTLARLRNWLSTKPHDGTADQEGKAISIVGLIDRRSPANRAAGDRAAPRDKRSATRSEIESVFRIS